MNETPQFTTKEIINLMAILKADIRIDKDTLRKENNHEFKELLEGEIQKREEIVAKAEQIWETYTQ